MKYLVIKFETCLRSVSLLPAQGDYFRPFLIIPFCRVPWSNLSHESISTFRSSNQFIKALSMQRKSQS